MVKILRPPVSGVEVSLLGSLLEGNSLLLLQLVHHLSGYISVLLSSHRVLVGALPLGVHHANVDTPAHVPQLAGLQTVFEGLHHVLLADAGDSLDVESREAVTGLRYVSLVTGRSVGVTGSRGVRRNLPRVIFIGYSSVQNTGAETGGVVTFITTFSEVVVRSIRIFAAGFPHILVARHLVTGVTVSVLVTVGAVSFQSLAEILLDALPVVPQQVTRLRVLLVVAAEPVLYPEILDVVRHLL